MACTLTNTTFSTTNNHDIFSIILSDELDEIYLRGPQKVDDVQFNNIHFEIEWPPNLVYLETSFRPDFTKLPSTIKTLSIVTQCEILKKNLPTQLNQLMVTCPNGKSVTFNPRDDDYDLYKISINSYGKKNKFVGGYFDRDADNIKHHDVEYYWQVEGDPIHPIRE